MGRKRGPELKIVIKIGGVALDDSNLRRSCARAIASLAQDPNVAVVHGGGVALTRTLKQWGKTSEFINGLRVTDSETRDVALMVLAGGVNKQVVAELAAVGCQAVGMGGGDGLSFRARKKNGTAHDLGFVGEICSTHARWLQAAFACRPFPLHFPP